MLSPWLLDPGSGSVSAWELAALSYFDAGHCLHSSAHFSLLPVMRRGTCESLFCLATQDPLLMALPLGAETGDFWASLLTCPCLSGLWSHPLILGAHYFSGCFRHRTPPSFPHLNPRTFAHAIASSWSGLPHLCMVVSQYLRQPGSASVCVSLLLFI